MANVRIPGRGVQVRFETDPNLMTEADLLAWVTRAVESKTPESVTLDYKQDINITSKEGKVELAKDVTSFANEVGGVLVYGVSEDREGDDAPVPDEIIGIDNNPNLKIRIEDILVDGVSPRLPVYRCIDLPHPTDSKKMILMIWVPKSWEMPHMVSLHGKHRYYGRANFRAVLLDEHEIARRYERRLSLKSHAQTFIAEEDFGECLFSEKTMLRLVVCPMMLQDRVDFRLKKTIDWLRANQYCGGMGWRSTLEGARYSTAVFDPPNYPEEKWRRFEIRIHRTAAFSYCQPICGREQAEGQTVDVYWVACQCVGPLDWLAKFLHEFPIAGPAILDFRIIAPKGLILYPFKSVDDVAHAIDSPSAERTIRTDKFGFQEILTLTDIMTSPKRVTEMIEQRLREAAGSGW